MNRYDEWGLLQPRYGRRPRNDDITITPRHRGQPYQRPAADTPIRANGHGNGARRVVVESGEEHIDRGGDQATLVLQAQAEAKAWKEKYARLYADQENDRKRLERLYASRAEQTTEQVLRDMLPLADNLARALAHHDRQPDGLKEGVELTLKAFSDTLAKHGVEIVEAEGDRFDPARHEATAAVPHPYMRPGTIINVEEAGYTWQGKLLRPARVVVAAD